MQQEVNEFYDSPAPGVVEQLKEQIFPMIMDALAEESVQGGHRPFDELPEELKAITIDQIFHLLKESMKQSMGLSKDNEEDSTSEMPGFKGTRDELDGATIRESIKMKKGLNEQILRIKSLNEQLMPNNQNTTASLGLPTWDKFTPKMQTQQKPDLSCVNANLFTQKSGDGKMYYVIDKPSATGGAAERIVLYSDGIGDIITGSAHNKGKWMCGSNGVEFRSDANPKAVRYLGKIEAPAAAQQNTQNVTVNCAASLDEIKEGSNKILKNGCKTDAVKKLQEMLGMPTNHQTGFFGNITKAKVIEFQKANKDDKGAQLKDDGIVGDKTYNALVKSKTTAPTPTAAPVNDATF